MDYIISRYDNCISYMDHFVGNLIDVLKKKNIYDNTMIILCADHGEELGERKTFNRFGNKNLYQEVIHVPLIIKWPDSKVGLRRIGSPVGLVDVMPTIIEKMHAGGGLVLQGKSLLPLIEGFVDPQPRSFVISEVSSRKWAMLTSDGWKLIVTPQRSELYDLSVDPKERNNVIDQNPHQKISMMQFFMSWYDDNQKIMRFDNRLKMDSRLIESLKKSGYW